MGQYFEAWYKRSFEGPNGDNFHCMRVLKFIRESDATEKELWKIAKKFEEKIDDPRIHEELYKVSLVPMELDLESGYPKEIKKK